jgi:hypothetical protein
MKSYDQVTLLQILETRFNDGELRKLCFFLDIDYDSLPGAGKADKARELVETGKQLRTDIVWPDVPYESSDFNPEYDVFLGYHSENETLAHQIDEKLTDAGLKVWFAQRDLRGYHVQRGLARGIRNSRFVVVLVGPSGIGQWAVAEVWGALIECVNRDGNVIPVILPGVEKPPELPTPLNQYRRVNCRKWIPQQGCDQLIEWITGKAPKKSISQVGDAFTLTLPKLGGREREINIYTLPNPDTPYKQLDLTWETLGQGIEILCDQMKNFGTSLDIDACFGINDAGLVMATFLNSSVMERTKIGYIRHKRSERAAGGRIISKDNSFFPKLPQQPRIMLIDFEIKSGGSIKAIVRRIRQEYTDPAIYFATLGAMTKQADLKIKSFDELVSADNISKLDIVGCFIACTTHPLGIEPPLKIR